MTKSETMREQRESLDEARRYRAVVLDRFRQECEKGNMRTVFPQLLAAAQGDERLAKIRLWQLDVLMFGGTQERALRWIRKTREAIGDDSPVKDGHATIGWAIASRKDSVRIVMWLYMLILREKLDVFQPPADMPYSQLFDTEEGDRN